MATATNERFSANGQAASSVDMLRRKLIRETERYLNNPRAESWGRLTCYRRCNREANCQQLAAA